MMIQMSSGLVSDVAPPDLVLYMVLRLVTASVISISKLIVKRVCFVGLIKNENKLVSEYKIRIVSIKSNLSSYCSNNFPSHHPLYRLSVHP